MTAARTTRSKTQQQQKDKEPEKVQCGTCQHFIRDTEGINHNVYTGEYFMGVSDIGCDPDHTFNERTGEAKIFADKLRVCPKHLPQKTRTP